MSRASWWLSLCGLATIAGCGGGKTLTVKEVYTARRAGPEAASPLPKDCEVSLQVENSTESGLATFSEQTCIKTLGQPLALPSTLTLWLDTTEVPAAICREGTFVLEHDRPTVDDDDGGAPHVAHCEWNGVFRESHPLTFRLRSLAAVGPDTTSGAPSLAQPLDRYIQGVRVLRNGSLVWTWLPGDARSGNGTEIVIPGPSLTQEGLPEGADLALRIFPVGVEIDQAVLSAKVSARPRVWEQQLQLAGQTLLTSPSLAQGTLGAKVGCLRYRAAMVQFYASQIVGSPTLQPKNPGACTAPTVPPPSLAGNSLVARYDGLKRRSISTLSDLQDGFVKDVEGYADSLGDSEQEYLDTFKVELAAYWSGTAAPNLTWWKDLDVAKANDKAFEKFKKSFETDPDFGNKSRTSYRSLLNDSAARQAILDNHPERIWPVDPATKPTIPGADPAYPPPSADEQQWLRLRATYTDVDFVAKSADQIVQQGLQAVDDTIALQADLREDAARIAGDTNEQAGLFLNLASSIQGTSPFESMVPNPEPVAGEQALPMHYSDPHQLFWLAPWTGFPIGIQGQGADFSAANLIPIVDVLGYRYQWSSGRLADLRVAAGLTALTFTTPVAVTGETQEQNKQLIRFAPEVNVSVSNFKVGAAYAVGTPRAGLGDEERFRVLVGADLYKLLSGNSLEAGTN